MQLRTALTFFLLLLLFSCEQELDMNEYIRENKLVLNCFITSDSTMQLYLGKTSSPFENPDFVINIENAAIRITDADNNIIPVIKIDPNSGYSFPAKIQYNSIYKISVEYPGYCGISAQSYLPGQIEIKDHKSKIIVKGENETVLENTFQIGTGQSRFLALRHIISEKIVNIYGDTIKFTDTVWINPSGNALKSILSENEINNILFAELNQNTLAELRFESYDGFMKSENLIEGISEFEFLSCSEHCYNYMRSALIYLRNQRDENRTVIFPSSVYSNIENGFGIFCGYEKTVFRIKYR